MAIVACGGFCSRNVPSIRSHPTGPEGPSLTHGLKGRHRSPGAPSLRGPSRRPREILYYTRTKKGAECPAGCSHASPGLLAKFAGEMAL